MYRLDQVFAVFFEKKKKNDYNIHEATINILIYANSLHTPVESIRFLAHI